MAPPTKKIKSAALRLQDPFLEREKRSYPHPLPSREFILSLLADQGVPLFPDELIQMLAIKDDERAFFERRLYAMARDGQIIINRKGAICTVQKLDLINCRVVGHRDGYGFAVPETGHGGDLFLSEREMHKVLHGDRVIVRSIGQDRRGRQEGCIVDVLERLTQRVVGRVYHEHGVWLLIAEDKRINQDILLESNNRIKRIKHGQVVVVEIIVPPDGHRQPIGRVLEVLGDYAESGMEIEIALRKYNLPYLFNDAAKTQAKKTPTKVRKVDLKGRIDMRDLAFVTIDGETARDFDDAVYAERQGKGFKLVVAIADVSHYVQAGDALDRAARERGTSVYFPRRVIPMLPEALSNGVCSLNPDVERLCMVCEIKISAQGKITSYCFAPAVIRSHARLSYTQVYACLQAEAEHELMPQLSVLYALFKVLLQARQKRGAIDFDTDETQMIFNEQGKIERIIPVLRNDAHRLIEECMLAANVCAANFLQEQHYPCLFRVHEGPTLERLENLRAYLRLVGLNLNGGDKPSAKDYALLANTVRNRPDALVLQTLLLRSMQQAIYHPDNIGHFGLAYEAYTHFTSPIRRYPDLLVHRAIKALLNKESYPAVEWLQLGEHCSMTERRADEASRDVQAWLKTYFMRDKIGEVFTGRIVAVTSFGVFVLLDEVYVEGLVHIAELGKDYFHYRKDLHAIIGEKSGLRYKMGDKLTVKLVRADLDHCKIDFQLINRV